MTKNSKSNIKREAVLDGKKSVKAIQQELGFGELPGSYALKGSSLDIDAALKKELGDKQFAYRFINFKTYKERGFHKSHWKPYKRTSTPTGGAQYTVDPDGYTVHQDLVLAVKPLEWHEAHKQYLRGKAERIANPQKLKAQEFRESMKQAGVNSEVVEGFEENS